MKSEVNSIYATFQGEQNIWGIGEPVIFLRFSFCHLRCYLATFGTLCDTPEALEKGSGTPMSVTEIVEALNAHSLQMGGVKKVCITGGDPLARPKEFLHDLFRGLQKEGFLASVETSGTLDVRPFLHMYPNVSWVLDYKGKSTGIEKKKNLIDQYVELTSRDTIKFVIADEADYVEMLAVINCLPTSAKIVAGVYQAENSKLTTFKLFEWLHRDSLLRRIAINMQTHKMANPDYFNNPLKYKDT